MNRSQVIEIQKSIVKDEDDTDIRRLASAKLLIRNKIQSSDNKFYKDTLLPYVEKMVRGDSSQQATAADILLKAISLEKKLIGEDLDIELPK